MIRRRQRSLGLLLTSVLVACGGTDTRRSTGSDDAGVGGDSATAVADGASTGGASGSGGRTSGGAGGAQTDASLDGPLPEAAAGGAPTGQDAAPDAPTHLPDAAFVDDGGACGARLSRAPGCADGLRRGLTDAARFPDIAVCAGAWSGDVSNGAALCAPGFHVCTGDEPALKEVTYADGTCFDGCYAFDAAQDNYQCLPDCSSQAGIADSAEGLDMGGLGRGCQYQLPATGSCITGGRIDATENDGLGCNYDPRLSGVVCCKDPPPGG